MADSVIACPVCRRREREPHVEINDAADAFARALRATFPADDIRPATNGGGAYLEQAVMDSRGDACGVILWSYRNTAAWSDDVLPAMKEVQGALRCDLAIIVSPELPPGITRMGMREGVLVSEPASALALASVVRVGLQHVAQRHDNGGGREETRDRLCGYLGSVDFLHRVAAIVDAFTVMRSGLERDRQSAEREWASRAQQIDTVTFIISGTYGRLHHD